DGGRAPDDFQKADERQVRTGRRRAISQILKIGRAACGLLQKSMEHPAQCHAECSKNDERPAPAVALPDKTSKETAHDCADVDAGLMNPHGSRSSRLAVIIADH